MQTGDRALRIELGRTRTAAGAKSIDGIDVLLQACAFWQRRNPVDAEEEECASNVFGVCFYLSCYCMTVYFTILMILLHDYFSSLRSLLSFCWSVSIVSAFVVLKDSS